MDETSGITNQKIMSLDGLVSYVAMLNPPDRPDKCKVRVVHCHGCFDLLHIGHIQHLEEAACIGDVLVVTVSSDHIVGRSKGDLRPIFKIGDRMRMLAALECVSAIACVGETTAADAISLIRPDFYVKGKDYVDSIAPAEVRAAREVGAHVLFTSTPKQSSSGIIERIRGGG